jgi:hypothetical protein
MTRPVAQPERESLMGAERDAFDRVVARYQRYAVDQPTLISSPDSAGPWGPSLHSPLVTAAFNELAKYFRTGGDRPGSFSDAERELVTLTLAFELDVLDMFVPVHVVDALAVGVRKAAIRAVCEGRNNDLTADERVVVDFVRGVAAGDLSDAAYDAMEAHLGVRGVVDLTMFVNFDVFQVRNSQAFGYYPTRPRADVQRDLQAALHSLDATDGPAVRPISRI